MSPSEKETGWPAINKDKPADQLNKKEPETEEKIIDALIEHMLLENAEKINEGNNGVIFLVTLDEIDKNLLNYLKTTTNYQAEQEDKQNNEAKEIAIKMLKIYSGGQGKREFEFQQKAFELIKAAEKTAPHKKLAKVPRPYFYRELDISKNKALQEKIKASNINDYRKKIEVILMDFVPGKDLATFLYQEVLKRHPETRHLAQTDSQNKSALEEMDIGQLAEETARALKFSYPAHNGPIIDDRVIRIFNENKGLLINFLKKQYDHPENPFKLPEGILEKLQNTVQLFHSNGFKHNDLHERNILLGDDKEIYIIDFGAALDFKEMERDLKGTDEDARQAEITNILRDDRGIFETLKKLSLSSKAEAEQHNNEKIEQALSLTEALIEKAIITKKELSAIKRLKNIEKLLQYISELAKQKMSTSFDAQTQIEAGLLYKFLQQNQGNLNNEELKDIFALYKKTHPQPYEQNLIRLVIKTFLK